MYKILPNDAQRKIPKEFVEEMEKYLKYDVGETINYPLDIGIGKILKRRCKKNSIYMIVLGIVANKRKKHQKL